ncbi:unnamed protein product [Rhizophagus irregularis]|nr:unnamed protein product [Rhizophagus irregularis]
MSTGRKELTAFERGEVIGAWKCGICERKISEALNHLKTTIHNIISAYKERRNETLPPRTGRQPIILERDGHQLVRILKKNRKNTLKELK